MPKSKPVREPSPEEEELEEHVYEQTRNIFARLRLALLHHPKGVVATVLVFFAVPVVYYGYNAYHSWQLMETANAAYAGRNYSVAVKNLTEYTERHPDDLDAALLLVRSHMLNGGIGAAVAVVDVVLKGDVTEDQNKESYYYLALSSMLEGKLDLASQHLRKVSLNDAVYPPVFYVRGMLQLYGVGDLASAETSFESALDKVKNEKDPLRAAEFDVRIDFARRLWDGQYQDVVKFTPSLPFAFLQEEPELESVSAVHGFKFSIPPDAFYNIYYVPSNRGALLAESINAEENTYILLAETALRRGRFVLAEEYLDALAQVKRDRVEQLSLKHMYFSAIVAIGKGDYLNAVDSYRLIDSRAESVDSSLLLAAARWGTSQGSRPEDRVMEGYQKALRLQQDNLIALVNMAHLHIVRGEAAEAAALLDTAKKDYGRNFYVLYNTALLDILHGEIIPAQDSLQELIAGGYESDGLMAVLTYALLSGGDGEEDDIISALQKLKTNERVSPATYMILADMYRRSEQPVLAVTELLAGRRKFPDDKDLLFELLLEYARQGEFPKYAALKEIIPDEEFQADYRAWLAEGLTSEATDTAGLAFQEALLVAGSVRHQENIMRVWLRYLQNEGEASRSAGVAKRVDKIYADAGGLPPPDLRMLQIWGLAPTANNAERKKLMAEVVVNLDDNVNLSPEMAEDVAYALAALGDSRAAAEILEPLAENYGSKRSLQLLLWAYGAMGEGDQDKVADVRRRMDAIGAEEVSTAKQVEFLRAAEEIQEVGLAVARSGEAELSGVALTGDDEDSAALRSALKRQDYEAAVDIYTQLLDAEDSKFTRGLLHQNRGVLYLKLEEYNAAIADFQAALDQSNLEDDDRDNVEYNYSLALVGKKDYGAAREVLGELVKRTGNNLRNLVLYAQLLNGFNDHEALVPVYERIIRLSRSRWLFMCAWRTPTTRRAARRMHSIFCAPVCASLRTAPTCTARLRSCTPSPATSKRRRSTCA